MANIKQQKKRDLTNAKKRLANASFMSSVKTAIKAFNSAVEAKDVEKANEYYALACKKIDKAVTKNIHHANWAAHQKSHLSVALNSLK